MGEAEIAQRDGGFGADPRPCYTRAEVARRAGIPTELAGRLWRALGFAALPDDAVAFGETDVAVLRRVRRMLDSELIDEKFVIRMARALGQTMARLSQWQMEIMIGAMLEPGERATAAEVAGILETGRQLMPDFEQILVYVWRTHGAAAAGRMMSLAQGDEVTPTRVTLAVGFADLVSFTQISRELDEPALAGLVEGFEARAADVIAAHGGRLIKTLGDEVLFTSDVPAAAASIALDLVELIGEDEGPRIRIGLARGPVLQVMGDVFGTTVNLAARLTAIARPGTVLVDAELAAALDGAEGVELTRIRRRPARGLGVVQPYVLRRGCEK